MALKQCFACGTPVADAALGRGAVETAEGRRYCSPCAARLKLDLTPEADAVRSVSPRPAAPVTPAAPARASAPTRTSAPETARSAARPRSAARRAASGPTARPRSTARIKPAPRPASAAARQPSRRPSSRLAKPGSRVERRPGHDAPAADGTATSRLTSRRSPRVDLPWYFRLSRVQIVGAAAAAAALVLLLAIGAAISSCGIRPNRRRPVAKNPVPYGGSAGQMMEHARQLVGQGKCDEALRVLEEAKAIAQKNGQDPLVVEINQKIHGLRFKTVR